MTGRPMRAGLFIAYGALILLTDTVRETKPSYLGKLKKGKRFYLVIRAGKTRPNLGRTWGGSICRIGGSE